MTRLFALLVSLFALMAFAPAAQAQDDDNSPYSRMPEALFHLTDSSYRCQALIGVEMHTEILTTVRNVTLKLSDNDEDLTHRFMTSAEAVAKQRCPDTSTCWREYLGVDASISATQATPLCEQKVLETMQTVSDLLQEIIDLNS